MAHNITVFNDLGMCPVLQPIFEKVEVESPILRILVEKDLIEAPILETLLEKEVLEAPVAEHTSREAELEAPVAEPIGEEAVLKSLVTKLVGEESDFKRRPLWDVMIGPITMILLAMANPFNFDLNMRQFIVFIGAAFAILLFTFWLNPYIGN